MSELDEPVAPAFDPKELTEALEAADEAGIVCCVAEDWPIADELIEFAAKGTDPDATRHEWECEGIVMRSGDGVLLAIHFGPEGGTELNLPTPADAIRTLRDLRALRRRARRQSTITWRGLA